MQEIINFRKILSNDILKNNQDKQLNQDDMDESAQRIPDRLIFIRNAEDRGADENCLSSNVRQWSSRAKGELIKEISKIYLYFDHQYNVMIYT
ncbi:MAG: hypothetical protein QXS75_03780 [Thermoplasmatales archaeon]